ncbi:hypothetical protein ACOZ4N_14965 [Halorientalis pallida]|uniref:hypothetical protein n=1 Tax=Halorientalis pallida TaxID=2479928 RepID=UPI003C70289F
MQFRKPLAIVFAALLTITLLSSGAVAQTSGSDGPSDGCTVVIDDDQTILDLLGGGDGGIVVTTQKLFEIVIQLITGNCL